MSAVTTDQIRTSKSDDSTAIPVAATTKIPNAVLVCRDTSGNAVNAADTAGLRLAGVSTQPADNTAGAAGALNVNVTDGRFLFAASGLAAGDEGKLVFVTDNNTVGLTSTNWVCAGRIAQVVSATSAWIDVCTDADEAIQIVRIHVGTVAAGQSDALAASYKLPTGRRGNLLAVSSYCVDCTGTATVDVKEGTDSVLSAVMTQTDATHVAGTVSDRALAAAAVINVHCTTAASTGAIVGGVVTLMLQLL